MLKEMMEYSLGLMDSRQEIKVLQNRISDGFSGQFDAVVSRFLTEQFTLKSLRGKNRKFKKQ